ncbi:hypothetical protein [Streptomyces lutosisoli]|uniref:Uncharacterized protein n=1 Tax=Streptomyces lutosisoli TaxID=2665721 RepID=A0ABW2VT01_9ACTN
MMNVNGYASLFPDGMHVEQLLIDGWARCSTMSHMAAHLMAYEVGDEDLVCAASHVEVEAAQDAFGELTDLGMWPVFRIPLKGGAAIAVIYRNFEDDPGVDYVLEPGADQPLLRLAAIGGEYFGPGIALSELHWIVRHGALLPDDVAKSKALLLLLPMVGDMDRGESRLEDLGLVLSSTSSWTNAERFINDFLDDHPLWESVTWASSGEILLCNGEHSPRNPASSFALPLHALQRVGSIFE